MKDFKIVREEKDDQERVDVWTSSVDLASDPQ